MLIEHTAYNTSTPYHFYTVRAVGEWKIVPIDEYSWCQAFPNEGKDEGVFRIVAKANDAITERVAYFKIIASGTEQPVLITVTQKANEPYITVTVKNEQGAKEQKAEITIPGPTEQTFYMYAKSNINWDLRLTDNTGGDESDPVPDWITATRLDGDSIRIVAAQNVGDQTRAAFLTYYWIDNPNVKQEIIINQEPGSYLKVPVLLFGTSKTSKILNCPVDANIPWTAVSNDTWITVGTTTETAAPLNIQENTTGALRTGTVTISSSLGFNFTVTIEQDELGDLVGFENPVEWEFTDAYFTGNVNGYNTQFVTNNELKSGKGANVATGTSTLSYINDQGGGLTLFPTDADIKRVIGGTGHPYVTGAWPGDWWLFKVPVENLRVGNKVNIKFLTRSSATGMRYWILECYDGGVWKAVGQTTTETVNGTSITYTHPMNTDATDILLNSTYTFTNSILTGYVQFRFRCVINSQCNGGTLANPNGGTHRIAGAIGTSPVISIVQ